MTALYDHRGFLLSGYDATKHKARRKLPSVSLLSEDGHLSGSDRKKLVSSTRDIDRNYSVAAWMIRRHLDYTTSFQFQPKTGDHGLDDYLEAIFEWYSRPENCDVLGRNDLFSLARMVEERAIVDGDVFLLKLSTGHLQPIEGDRICSDVALPKSIKDIDLELINGVQVGSGGKPRGYIVTKRSQFGRNEFERFLRAAFVIQHGYFTRFDQVRGISPLAPAINALRDLYEASDFALAKMKLSQLLGLIFYREDYGDANPSDEPYQLDFKDSLASLQLDPGDKVDLLESKNPSTEFQAFTETSIMLALKALDIPFCHWDEGEVNYSGGRRADQGYEQSARVKRNRLRRVLDNITRWRFRLMIQDGELSLPRGMTLRDLHWEFVNTATQWYLDPLKEVKADIEAVNAGFISTPEVAKMRGRDAYDIAREQAEYLKHRSDLGLPEASVGASLGVIEDDE